MRVLLTIAIVGGIMLGLAWLLGPTSPAPSLPADLVGLDATWLTQARQLSNIRLALFVAQLVATPLVLWLVVRMGWLAAVRTWLQGHGWGNPWLVVAVCTVGVLALLTLAALPFDYVGLLVRRQYGLSHEATGAWLGRQLLSFAVALIFALIAAEGFWWVVRITPRWWWLWASIGYLVLAVGQVYLAPLVITPLFFKQTPLADQALREEIVVLGQHVGVPIRDVFVIDASKQGDEGNAYFTGVGGSTRVVVYDTLLRNYPRPEMLAIVAHELGHWHARHVWKGLLLSAALAPLGLLLVHIGAQRWLPRWGITGLHDPAALPLLLLVTTLTSTATFPAQNALSRRWESVADRIALQATGDGPALARTFARLARQNLSNPTPAPLVEGLFATHPALGRRVATAQHQASDP